MCKSGQCSQPVNGYAMSVRTGTRSWVSGGKPDVRTLTTASLTIHKDARFKPNSRGFGLFCALAVQLGAYKEKRAEVQLNLRESPSLVLQSGLPSFLR